MYKRKFDGKLKQLGAKEQLLMLVTGPAGAGKSTAIYVAQQICCEFCKSMEVIRGEKTFLFTAISGCEAVQFGQVTLHSAAYLNSKSKNISPQMLHTWEQVRMLIIDEISFFTCYQMDKLSKMFNHICRKLCYHNKTKSYCHPT
jgi:thymidine kinase